MLRRTLWCRVHLFSALVPTVHVENAKYFTADQLDAAKRALEERKSFLSCENFSACLDALDSIPDMRHRQDLIKKFSAVVDECRASLYSKTMTDPSQRLQIHEAIMAAGYYQRALAVNTLAGEPFRFVLNHYNFDVRRDVQISKNVHRSLHDDEESTADSDKMLVDLLQLERRLSGKYRLAPTGGRRWLVLGLALSELKTEEDVARVLKLAPIQSTGNFSQSEADTDKLWKTLTVRANDEELKSFVEEAGLHDTLSDAEMAFDLRVQKPAAPLDWWEKFYETLLRYWVIWFSLWVMFFMVDEEIITLVTLIFLKHRQMKIMEYESEKSGGKVYIASATGRSM